MGEKEEVVLECLLGDEHNEYKTALLLLQEQELERVGKEVVERLKKGNIEYGESNEYVAKIVSAFRTLTKKDFTIDDYYLLMLLTKIAREVHSHKKDSLLDLAGYALLWLKYRK